uniref:Cytochrome P450 4V2 (inferred by orthology to a human protein) n=1 Tax=Strongyloides venezuelensis TaxID=75913 RepID=A0A0K0FXB8_STRVS
MIILLSTITFLFLFLTKNFRKITSWWHESRRKVELGEKIPGPRGYPVFGNMLALMGTPNEMKKKLDKENNIGFENNDPLRRYWIGNDLLVYILRADAAKVIFDSNIEISKGSMYDFFSELLAEGLVTSDGEKWKERRRLLTPTFHFNMLKKYFDVYNSSSRVMVENIKEFVENNREIDAFTYCKKITLDVICETAMGVKLNAQNDSENHYLEACNKLNDLFLNYFINIFYKITFFYYLFGDGFERKRNIEIMKKFTNNVIKEKAKYFNESNEAENDNSFLSNLLTLKGTNNWTDEDIREEVDTFMFAGHETSATLLSFLWWALACHQDVQEKVYNELYSVYGDEKRDVFPEDLPKLPYLDMVIKETVRMYVIVPMYGRSLKNEIEICGFTIPKGTDILFCPMHTNFNPKIFPDPHTFDPYRFLPENIAKRNAYDFTPFSAGPRNCIGQKFAINEVKTVIVWLIRQYKLTTKKDESYIEHCSLMFQKNEGVPVMFEKRL